MFVCFLLFNCYYDFIMIVIIIIIIILYFLIRLYVDCYYDFIMICIIFHYEFRYDFNIIFYYDLIIIVIVFYYVLYVDFMTICIWIASGIAMCFLLWCLLIFYYDLYYCFWFCLFNNILLINALRLYKLLYDVIEFDF